MADENKGEGIVQLIRLLLDKESAKEVEKQMQAALSGGSDPKQVEKHTSIIGGFFHRLKEQVGELGAAIVAAFALERLKEFGEESVKAALEARKEWNLLGQALNNVGININDVREHIETLGTAWREAGIGTDKEMQRSLTTLVQISGDYEKSLKNLGLVADLSAAKQISLEEAAMLVGRAMVGNVTMFKRMGIEIKPGSDAIVELDRRFHGYAASIDPAIRAQVSMNAKWDELKEGIGEALLETSKSGGVFATLSSIIESLTRFVEENKEGISNLGDIFLWIARIAGAAVIGTFSALIQVVEGAAMAYTGLLLAIDAVAGVLGISDTALEVHIGKVRSFIAEADKAAAAADKMARAIIDPKEGSPLKTPASGAVGGAVAMAKGKEGHEKTPEQIAEAEERALQKRIRLAKESLQFDNLRADGMMHLLALEDELKTKLDDTNLSFDDRVQATKDLKEVQDALVDGLKGMARQAGITDEAMKNMWEGNWKAAFRSIAKEAAISAGWNIAKAAEEEARALGWIGLGNFASASAAHASAAAHLASAGKWAALAGGAAAGASSGGGGTSGTNAPENLGGDAANATKNPGVQVTVYVDGVDPDNSKHQARMRRINQQIKERYGDTSYVTVTSGTGR
jgi:hypothetical protein